MTILVLRRLHCIPKLPFEQLRVLTASADVGLSLDKAGHGNYEMSLPNKLLRFHARGPSHGRDCPERSGGHCA